METKEHNTNQEPAANQQKAMESVPPQRKTVWSAREKIVRLLWGTVGRAIWICCPCFRSPLLRLFGATVGRGCKFASSAEITIPWNLNMGDSCHVSDYVILYNLGTITIGNRVRIDTRAHLCAGTHDMRDTTFPLMRPPISIGDDSFIGVDAYIAPDVSLGANTIVHHRASVYRNFEGNVELLGNPARITE